MPVTALPSLDVAAIRRDFPILATRVHGDVPLVYFDNAATTQRPRQVIQSIVETSERHYANVHRGIHTLSEQSTEMFENAREKVRAFINAPAAGAAVVAEGPQSVPPQTVYVQTLNAVFVAFSGHKMLGPCGVATLYGRRGLLEAMPPFLGGGSMIRRVTLEGFEPAELPAKL